MGRTLLYWWPDDGWQRGTMARLCPRAAFLHVVAYTRQTSALPLGTADSLRDAAYYGGGAFVPGPGDRGRPGPPVSGYPSLTFTFKLVGGS